MVARNAEGFSAVVEFSPGDLIGWITALMAVIFVVIVVFVGWRLRR
jgi:hypothetical protein